MTDLAFDLYLLAAALGLVPAVAYAGMPVLAQSAFLALGAVGAMQLERAGLAIGSAVLLAVLGGAVAGALLGALLAGAERARVALATWGLAWLATTALLAFPELSGGTQGLTRPAQDRVETYFGAALTLTPTAHAVLALLLCALALGVAERLRRGPAGRDAVALREDVEAALAVGVPVAVRKAALLALAGAFGAAAGAGFALLLGVAAPADTSPLLALQLFAAVIVGAGAPVAGPVLAFAVIAGVPRVADGLSETGISAEAANGVVTAAALIACLWLRPHVEARTRRRPRGGVARERAAGEGARGAGTPSEGTRGEGTQDEDARDEDARDEDARDEDARDEDARGEGTRDEGTLSEGARDEDAQSEGAWGDAGDANDCRVARAEAEQRDTRAFEVRVRGLKDPLGILHGIDLDLRAGEIHALIGPNGSGKTTAVRNLDGARTLQRAAALDPLTPYEQMQIAVPRERLQALLAFVGLSEPRDPWPALELVELTNRANVPGGELGAGEERLLQIARAAATGAQVLLLDEPAAGMRPDERATLERVLRRLKDSGHAVLVVEHDLRLVARAADVVTVLDEGRVIATGTPDEVIADAAVRRVYLGVTA